MVDARQDETGLRSNTAIVFWGDHGYQLGEKGIWCKVTNFELATRVPLIVSIPGQQNPGGASMALVEHLDIYPTLADIAGIAIPPATMGRSMLHLVDAPASWSATARGGGYPNSGGSAFNASYSQILRNDGIMGYTMRTDRWRVTRWGKFSALTGRPDFESPPLGVELYDHAKDTEADFDAFENVNLATAPGYTATVAELLLALETTWDNGKLPPAGPPPQPPSPSPSPSPAPPGRKFEFVLADTVSQGGGTISFGVDADRDESEANGKGQGEGESEGVSMCLSTDGATGVVVGSCGTGVASAEWVQIGAARDAVAAGGSGDIEGGGVVVMVMVASVGLSLQMQQKESFVSTCTAVSRKGARQVHSSTWRRAGIAVPDACSYTTAPPVHFRLKRLAALPTTFASARSRTRLAEAAQ